ncbi:hypothetical protein QJS66_16530 [Kocuria rhizophila]|nr:hypothetical protein QJS66_16530 [Kocuria rhizophila]
MIKGYRALQRPAHEAPPRRTPTARGCARPPRPTPSGRRARPRRLRQRRRRRGEARRLVTVMAGRGSAELIGA